MSNLDYKKLSHSGINYDDWRKNLNKNKSNNNTSNEKVKLTLQDGKEIGVISSNAYYAISNNLLDYYEPADKDEKKVIDKYKNYIGYGKTYDTVKSQYGTDKYGKGNIDLTNRPVFKNIDGSISTVESISINEDGKEILIPTVIKDEKGRPKRLSEKEAIDHYHKTGEYLGKFNTIEEADDYAQSLHIDQDWFYSVTPDITVEEQKVFDKYNLNPMTFSQEDYEKWALEHGYEFNYSYNGNGDDVYIPKSKKGKLVPTAEEQADFQVLSNVRGRENIKNAVKNPVVATVMTGATVLGAPAIKAMSAIANTETVGNFLTDKGIVSNSAFQNAVQNTDLVRSEVSNQHASKWFGGASGKIGNYGSLLYNSAMSIGDTVMLSLTTRGIGSKLGLTGKALTKFTANATSGLLSSHATQSTILQKKKEGLSDGKSIAVGITTGLTEYLTEKYSLEAIFKTPASMIKKLLTGFIAEGSEEGFSDIFSKTFEYFIAGDDSSIKRNISNYMNDGMSKADATKQATWDSIWETVSAVVSGGFSGMGMSAAYHGFAMPEIKQTGKDYRDIGKEIIQSGLKSPKNTTAYKHAEKLQKKGVDKASDYEIGLQHIYNIEQIEFEEEQARKNYTANVGDAFVDTKTKNTLEVVWKDDKKTTIRITTPDGRQSLIERPNNRTNTLATDDRYTKIETSSSVDEEIDDIDEETTSVEDTKTETPTVAEHITTEQPETPEFVAENATTEQRNIFTGELDEISSTKIPSVSVGDAFIDKETNNIIEIIGRDENTTTVRMTKPDGTKTTAQRPNNRADTLTIDERFTKVESTVKAPVETVNTPTETVKPQAKAPTVNVGDVYKANGTNKIYTITGRNDTHTTYTISDESGKVVTREIPNVSAEVTFNKTGEEGFTKLQNGTDATTTETKADKPKSEKKSTTEKSSETQEIEKVTEETQETKSSKESAEDKKVDDKKKTPGKKDASKSKAKEKASTENSSTTKDDDVQSKVNELAEKIRNVEEKRGDARKRSNNAIQWIKGISELQQQFSDGKITYQQYDEALRKDSVYRKLDDVANELQNELDSLIKKIEQLTGKSWKEIKSKVLYPEIHGHLEVDNIADNGTTTEETETEESLFIDDRTWDDVSSRKVKAFQFEHPEVKPFYKTIAQELLSDIKNTTKGERTSIHDGVERTWTGTKRFTSEAIARIKDVTGATYDKIEDALHRIINDQGAENVALSKKIELVIDDMLSDGYTSFDGQSIPANEEYLAVKEELSGREYTPETSEDDDYLSWLFDYGDERLSLSSMGASFFGNEKITADEFEKMLEDRSYKEHKGYKDYLKNILKVYTQTHNVKGSPVNYTAEIERQIEGIIRVGIAAKKSGYDILDDGKKRTKSDSKKRLLFSTLEPNSDYVTSSDISTICDKAKNFTEIYDMIVKIEESRGVPADKRFFMNVDNYFILHKLLADKGLTIPCDECYVQAMRKNLTPMANAFIKLVTEENPNNKDNEQLYHQDGKDRGNVKKNNAEIREKVRELCSRTDCPVKLEHLTLEKLTTADGLAELRLEAPLLYETFNSFYGQSKPKMPREASPFRPGELIAMFTNAKGEIKTGLVNKIKATGGFRLQSYSDFQIENYVDVLQTIFEASMLGLNGHAYTKVPAFLEATKGTNLKRNISIFMYEDGGKWMLDKKNSFPMELEDIYALVASDESGNTSIIAVSQNEDMSAWIMANDNVGYGIPFHKSGTRMEIVRGRIVKTPDGREVFGYANQKDHTKQQTEVWKTTVSEKKKINTKVNKPIDIYKFWDFENKGNLSKKELLEKNLKKYIDVCNKANYRPKFREYLMNNEAILQKILQYSKELGYVSQDATIDDISFEYDEYRIPYGYYKFLGDFGMFKPDGTAAPIDTLSLENYDFEGAEKFFANKKKLKANELLQQFENGKVRDDYRQKLEKGELTIEQLSDILKKKREAVAMSVVDGTYADDETRLSISQDEDDKGKLTNSEWNEFYRSLGELKRGMWFPQTSDGDYIFETEDKLIFTDGNYEKPKVNSVVVFEDLEADEIEYGKEIAYYVAQRDKNSQECYEAIGDVLGYEYVTRTNPYSDRAYQESEKSKGKRSSGSKTDRGTESQVRLSLDTYAPTFYSHMAKTIDAIKQDKIGASSVVSYLTGRGVKAEEIKWSGIEEFLAGKKSVTKAELQEFVASNQLQIEETVLEGGEAITIESQGTDTKDLYVMRGGAIHDTLTWNEKDQMWESDSLGYTFLSEDSIRRYYGDGKGKTRWGDYKLDGGENYREITFTMPNSTHTNQAMKTHWGDNAKGILAHARVQDFEVDGKKMLFVEEIQSDWHNEGASRGYKSKLSPNEQNTVMDLTDKRTQLFNELRDVLEEIRKTAESAEKQNLSAYEQGQLTAPLWEKAHKLREEERALLEKSQKIEGQGDVPDAPFRDNYHEYVLKNLIRMAAEQGYDSIGWTTADIQSKRWSDKYAEGYRIEYDQDIPKFLNKYGKKWGAKVGKTEIGKEDGGWYEVEGTEVWAMPITDSMKDSVLYEGQALYSLAKEGNNNEQRNGRRSNTLYNGGKRGSDESTRKQVGGFSTFEQKNKGKTRAERKSFAKELLEQGQTEEVIEKTTRRTYKYNLVKPEAYNDDMKALVEEAKRNGIELGFFVGEGRIAYDSNKVLPINGIKTGKGKILVQYDHNVAPQKIFKHECGHFKWKTAEMQKVKETILNGLTEAEKEKILSTDRYQDYMDFYKGKKELVWEEFVVDTLSGMNEYTERFIDTVNTYWYGNESAEGYTPSTYAESIDAGGTQSFVENIGFGDEHKMSLDSQTTTSERDAEYLELAKNPKQNEARLRELVDEAARNAGYRIRAYHGTSAKFTVFDKSKQGKNNGSVLGNAFYFASDRDIADEWGGRSKTMSVYLKLQNSINVDSAITEEMLRAYEALPGKDISELEEFYNSYMKKSYPTFEDYLKVYEENSKRSAEIDTASVGAWVHAMNVKSKESSDNTSTNLLKGFGIDGIVSEHKRNGRFPEWTEYAIFDENQIKSADLVTYDDDGNIIPLSERFNEAEDDLRFSIVDEDIAQVTPETLREMDEQFKADKFPINKPTFKEAFGERAEWVAHNMTRVFPDIPERGEQGVRFAEFRKMMIQWKALPQTAQFMVQDRLTKMTKDLSPKEFETFSKMVYYLDLQEEAQIQKRKGYDTITLPHGRTVAEVNAMVEKLKAEATDNVNKALKKRQAMWDAMTKDYIRLNQYVGFDTSDMFNRKHYYHNQVQKEVNKSALKPSKKDKNIEVNDDRDWLKERQISTEAINTDFLAVEYKAMLQMQYDIYIANILGKIKDQYDIKPQLEKDAFDHNKEMLKEIIEKEATDENGNVDLEKSESRKKEQWFNERILGGYEGLMELAELGKIPAFKGQFEDIINALKNHKLNVPGLYNYVTRLASMELSDNASEAMHQAVISARTVMKYTSQKKAWLKELLGYEYQDWEILAKKMKATHSIHQPRRGNYFYTKDVVNEDAFSKAFNDMILGLVAGENGVDVNADVKKLFEQYSETVRLMGAAYEQWVIPNEIETTMNKVANPKDINFVNQLSRTILSTWKGWSTSVNPLRTVKFGVRNMFGDLDAVIACNPKVVRYSKQAIEELYQAMKNKKYTPEFMEWVERGGYSSLLFANEMDTKMQEKVFKHLFERTKDEKTLVKLGKDAIAIPAKIVEGYSNGVEVAHNFREAILRYSAYLYFKNQIIKNGGTVKDNVASNRYIVQGLHSVEDKAYQLSKDLLGAYDEVATMGQALRRHAIPFYSFTETNLKRYYRMFENIIMSNDSIPKKAGKLMLKTLMVNLLPLLTVAWNRLVMKDEDDELPPQTRNVPHITLGNGYAFRQLGSFSELLEWFGLEDYKWTEEDLLAPVDKVAGMLTPLAKTPLELVTGLNFYPSITQPRAIRDRWEHFFNSLGVADIYKNLTGKPTRGFFEMVSGAFIYHYDEKESAYYELLDIKREYQGDNDGSIYKPDAKSNALYYMKTAIRYKDKKAALKYLEEYFENGGTGKGITQSIAMLNPMYGYTSEEGIEKGEAFVKSLSSDEKEKLRTAINYYENDLMLPENVSQRLRKKDITDTEAKNLLKNYINAKCR